MSNPLNFGTVANKVEDAVKTIHEQHRKALSRGQRTLLCHPMMVEAMQGDDEQQKEAAKADCKNFYTFYEDDYLKSMEKRLPGLPEKDRKALRKDANGSGYIPDSFGKDDSFLLPEERDTVPKTTRKRKSNATAGPSNGKKRKTTTTNMSNMDDNDEDDDEILGT